MIDDANLTVLVQQVNLDWNVGASMVVTPPRSGGLPTMSQIQKDCGFPFGSKPALWKSPVKFTNESMPEIVLKF